MPWLKASYLFASTFSYRLPNFSGYAISAPMPSPSTIKLAMVSTVINRTGDVEKGERLFDNLRTSNVALKVPYRIVAFKAFIKRLKKKRQEKGFKPTFGIREYIIYDGPLTFYIDMPEDVVDETVAALEEVSYFGTSDSLCTCTEVKVQQPDWNRCARSEITEEDKAGIIFLLTDFTEKAGFENVNPYSPAKLILDQHLILRPYLFPLQVSKKRE